MKTLKNITSVLVVNVKSVNIANVAMITFAIGITGLCIYMCAFGNITTTY